MNRREFIALIAGAAAGWPLAGRAQQPAMPVIGFLSSLAPSDLNTVVSAFHEGLNGTGFVEGRSVAIEYRWAEGDYQRLPALCADLVRRKVALIAAIGGTPLRGQPRRPRRPFPSCSRSAAIRSRWGWFPASAARTATSPA
jgi:putative ABC transport system substrate-binding protein